MIWEMPSVGVIYTTASQDDLDDLDDLDVLDNLDETIQLEKNKATVGDSCQ